jgi:hypothetical protein
MVKIKTLPHYRQGDVLLERVDSLPKTGLTKVPRVDGLIVVALGSSNGNLHFFRGKDSSQFTDADGRLFYILVGTSMNGRYTVEERKRNWLILQTGKGPIGLVAFRKADCVEEKSQPGMATVKGRFELLNHAEHTPHAYLEGAYSQEPQRGFNRGEMRNVLD